jgi:hypothetical protein
MKIGTRFSRLCGWSVPCASCALALAFCASAFASDPSKDVGAQPTQKVAQPKVVKICYVKTIASGIPEQCDRVFGAFTTTANAMEIIGRAPEQGETARSAVAQLERTVTQAQRGD